MLARIHQATGVRPLALVVYDNEREGVEISRALRNRGYRTFTIDATCSDIESLTGLQADVIVLDARRTLLGVTKTLVELSKRPDTPPVVLVADGDDVLWVAARFNLLVVSEWAGDAEIEWVVERSRRERRRPRAPR
jgi:CheY-like chemotaxis protein